MAHLGSSVRMGGLMQRQTMRPQPQAASDIMTWPGTGSRQAGEGLQAKLVRACAQVAACVLADR